MFVGGIGGDVNNVKSDIEVVEPLKRWVLAAHRMKYEQSKKDRLNQAASRV